MKTQYTQGPWIAVQIAGGNYSIMPKSHAKHPAHIIASVHENHGECDLGNANLISAAPGLLCMLQRMIDETSGGGVPCLLTLEQARAAISKAEGTKP